VTFTMDQNNTRIERLTGVPASRLEAKVVQFKADPDYISHKTIKEDAEGKFWTIEVTLKAVN
jgi:putative lipoic acid-binding regulatory protein